MPTNDFPQDLRDAQLALHQARAAYERYAADLPWSAEPMPGWEGGKQLYSGYRSSKPDSPGYTDGQKAQVAEYRERLLELCIVVSTHPYWETLGEGKSVAARTALKHVHETADVEAA